MSENTIIIGIIDYCINMLREKYKMPNIYIGQSIDFVGNLRSLYLTGLEVDRA